MNQDPTSQLYRPFLPTWLLERIGLPELQPGLVHTCDATILYADLSGFTKLAAAFATLPDGAEILHDSLTQLYDVLIDTIIAHGGDVVSIAGDALTGWWPEKIDTSIAHRCGMAMIAALLALPAITTPQGPFRLDLRIGISAGPVYVVLAGLPSHGLHLVLTGPAIAAATASERRATPGTIHIAEPLSASVSPSYITRSADQLGTLSWEHFLPTSFVERLRYNELVAEYRRCVPAFASFDLPRRPEDLHRLVAQVQAVILRWGGWLNEVEVGDKGAVFVLLFGAPVSRGDDTSRAVGCCQELLSRKLIKRAAVTVGILFVGAVGNTQRRVYTAQGEDMNLAAHLMERAAPGEILVSGRVRADIVDRYQTSQPELVVTKGYPDGVPVARLITPGPRPGRGGGSLLRGLPDSVVMIGRSVERAQLASTALASAIGKPQIILLEGESGIGKSCLLQELALHWVERGYRGYSSECSSGGQMIPLAAWRPILIDICGIDEGATPRIQRTQLSQALAILPQTTHATQSLFARTLGLADESVASDSGNASDDMQQLLSLAAHLISTQVDLGPLLIILEDVHWADEYSLQLVNTVLSTAPRNRPFPICLVLSQRPVDEPLPTPLAELRNHPDSLRIVLGRLSSDESTKLISALLGVSTIHPKMRQHIERHTEGQPLFIKEYLRVLRQHGMVLIDDDSARLSQSLISLQVVNSAQGVIQARVDRLDEATRMTLKVAAVIGRSFPYRLLARVHPGNPSDAELISQLGILAALQIIELELDEPERVYRFKYGITHEVAYTSLLFGQRRLLHTLVAQWYEQAYAAEIATGNAPMAVYDLLIDHLRRAEDWSRQLVICRLAAQQANRNFATDQALRYIEQALLLASNPVDRYNVLLLRIAINERLGNHVTQADDLAQLEQLSVKLGDLLRRAYQRYFSLRYLLSYGRYHTGAAMAQTLQHEFSLARHRVPPPEQERANILLAAIIDTRGSTLAALGDLRHAARLHRQALNLCQAALGSLSRSPTQMIILDPLSLAVRCLNNLGSIKLCHGDRQRAQAYYQQALELARSTGDLSSETRARERLGDLFLLNNNLEAATDEAQRALSISHAVSDRTGQSQALRQLAQISAAYGDYAEAQRRAWHALAISTTTRSRVIEVEILQDIAHFAAAQGQDEEAEAARLEANRVREQWWDAPIAQCSVGRTPPTSAGG